MCRTQSSTFESYTFCLIGLKKEKKKEECNIDKISLRSSNGTFLYTRSTKCWIRHYECVSGVEMNRTRGEEKNDVQGNEFLIRSRAESFDYKEKKKRKKKEEEKRNKKKIKNGERLEFLGSLVGTIMHTVFPTQQRDWYDILGFPERGHLEKPCS